MTLGVTAGFPRQDLCAEPDSYLRAPGPVAGGCALPASSARLSDQLRHALSKMKNNLVRLFLETSPLDLSWRLLQRMADAVVAVRPGRKFPRDMKKVRVPGFQMQYRRTR